MKQFWADFKKFITRGNVMELAVAVIIGTAFNKITSSLVNDVIMPIISLAVGGISVEDWKWVITPEVVDSNGVIVQAENALKYGSLIQAIIDFLLIALIVFIILRVFKSADARLQQLALENKMLTKAQRKELRKQGKTLKEIRQINIELLKKAQEEQKAQEERNKKPTQEELLTQIRDLLVAQNNNGNSTANQQSDSNTQPVSDNTQQSSDSSVNSSNTTQK